MTTILNECLDGNGVKNMENILTISPELVANEFGYADLSPIGIGSPEDQINEDITIDGFSDGISKQISLINAEFDLNAQAIQLTGGRDDLISKDIDLLWFDYYGDEFRAMIQSRVIQFSIGFITEVT